MDPLTIPADLHAAATARATALVKGGMSVSDAVKIAGDELSASIEARGLDKPLKIVAFVCGPTCAGKSTLLAGAVAHFGQKISTIKIGEALRAKYGAAYFKGQMAPQNTQAEAMGLFREQLADRLSGDSTLVLVDGLPRTESQIKELAKGGKGWCPIFLWLHTKEEILAERVASRASSVEEVELTVARITNDRLQWCDLFPTLCTASAPLLCCKTDGGVDAPKIISKTAETASSFLHALQEAGWKETQAATQAQLEREAADEAAEREETSEALRKNIDA